MLLPAWGWTSESWVKAVQPGRQQLHWQIFYIFPQRVCDAFFECSNRKKWRQRLVSARTFWDFVNHVEPRCAEIARLYPLFPAVCTLGQKHPILHMNYDQYGQPHSSVEQRAHLFAGDNLRTHSSSKWFPRNWRPRWRLCLDSSWIWYWFVWPLHCTLYFTGLLCDSTTLPKGWQDLTVVLNA